MENIFKVGEVVEGKSLIGRKKLIEKYRDMYLFSDYPKNTSVVGLTRSGKTSFKNAIFRDPPDEILIIDINLSTCFSYKGLWLLIINEISDYCQRFSLSNSILNDSINKICSNNDIDETILYNNVFKIFDELNNENIRTIIVFDEFDFAEILFKGSIQYFMIFRSLFSEARFNVSAFLISRRQLSTIEKSTGNKGSRFYSVFDLLCFKGFDDDDWIEYLDVFKEYGINLSTNETDQLLYYAGRSPFLLSILGHFILEVNKELSEINIEDIFQNKCNGINHYYKQIYDFLEKDGDLEKLAKIIIGPRVDITKKDLDDLTNLGYIYYRGNSLLAMSEYFNEEFLTSSIINIDINKKFLDLEGLWRKMIRKEFSVIVENKKLYANDILELQKEFLKQVKSKNGDPLPMGKIEAFRDSTKRKYNRDIDYIDATGPRECVAIFWDSWDLCFKNYFNNDDYSKWDDKLDKLSLARNPEFHPNPKDGPVLNALEKNEANLYIEQIFDVISNSEVNLKEQLSDAEILIIARKNKPDNENEELYFLVPDLSLIGKKVEFEATGFGGNTKETIRGVVDGKYKAVIPRDKSQVLSDDERKNIIGTKLPVVITEIRGEKCFLDFI